MILEIAKGKFGIWLLVTVAFFEATILLLPVDLVLLAIVPISVYSWKRIALIATISSTIGGLSGYLLGYLGWQKLALPLLEQFFHLDFTMIHGRKDIMLPSYLIDHFSWLLGESKHLFEAYENIGFGLVFLFALIPFPYRLIAATSGAASMPVITFILASLAGRGLRFALVCCGVHYSYVKILRKWLLLPEKSPSSLKKPSQKTRR